MTRSFVTAAASLSILLSIPLEAHHGYDQFHTDQRVTVIGTVQRVVVKNPHVLLTVAGDDGVTYEAIWGGADVLRTQRIADDMPGPGERVIISGSPHRDPREHTLAILQEVRPLQRSWHWCRGGPRRGEDCANSRPSMQPSEVSPAAQERLRNIPPELVRSVTARYTPEARAERIEGTVVLRALVREDGTVDPAVEVVRSLDARFGLDQRAIVATREWRFRPARRDGDPVSMHVTIEQHFDLGRTR